MGLHALISDRPYETTAEMMEPGQVTFIPWTWLLQFMDDHSEVGMRVTEHLSGSYYTVHETVRNLGLAGNVAQKVAKFLLSVTPRTTEDGHEDCVLSLTHQEMVETL